MQESAEQVVSKPWASTEHTMSKHWSADQELNRNCVNAKEMLSDNSLKESVPQRLLPQLRHHTANFEAPVPDFILTGDAEDDVDVGRAEVDEVAAAAAATRPPAML